MVEEASESCGNMEKKSYLWHIRQGVLIRLMHRNKYINEWKTKMELTNGKHVGALNLIGLKVKFEQLSTRKNILEHYGKCDGK